MGRNAIACATLAWVWALAADPAAAQSLPALRVPQVHVNNGLLQGYLDGLGEHIDVQTDQRDAQLLSGGVTSNSTFTLQFEFAGSPGYSVGLYNGHAVPGTLMPLFSTSATNGWFTVASWRSSPVRVVINMFDNNATFLGQTTFLGADRSAIGLYLASPHATYFTQDWLNPDRAPRALFYEGTGINAGALWLAWEGGDAPADFDFADAVVFIEVSPYYGVVPVQRATWSELKSRFR